MVKNWVSPPNRMDGYMIWCFDCKGEFPKRVLRTQHLNHEVHWVTRPGHKLYVDEPVPRAKLEDAFS